MTGRVETMVPLRPRHAATVVMKCQWTVGLLAPTSKYYGGLGKARHDSLRLGVGLISLCVRSEVDSLSSLGILTRSLTELTQ